MVEPDRSLRARTCGNTVSCCSHSQDQAIPPPAGHRRNTRTIFAAPLGLFLCYVLEACAISSIAFCWGPKIGAARHPGPYELGGASSSTTQWVQIGHSRWEEIGACTDPVAGLSAPLEEKPSNQRQTTDIASIPGKKMLIRVPTRRTLTVLCILRDGPYPSLPGALIAYTSPRR